MYGNVQETKNLMSHYESDGDYVNYKVSCINKEDLHYAD